MHMYHAISVCVLYTTNVIMCVHCMASRYFNKNKEGGGGGGRGSPDI